jgi:predicted ribosome quality control (RQC) complex YloA/Tae2 family protein
MRRYLQGAVIQGIEQINFDRLLQIEFINAQRLGPESRCTLVAEVMGRHSNVLLLDQEGVILECLKHVPAEVNRYRQSLPGLEYVPPPDFGKVDPFAVKAAEFDQIAAQADSDPGFKEWFRSNFQGGSDVLVAELAARTGITADMQLSALGEEWLNQLSETLMGLYELISTPGEAYICRRGSTDTSFAYPFPPQSQPDVVTTPVRDLSAALDEVCQELQYGQQSQQLREQLLHAAGKQLDHILTRARKRKTALKSVSDADKYRKWGELILAHLNKIPPRAEEVTVTDYYSEDQSDITIALDPDRRPQEVAQHYFKRYKRAQRLSQRLPRLLKVDRIHQNYLEGLLHQIENAEQLADLQELRQEMIDQDILRPPKRPQPHPEKRSLPRYESQDGYLVVYGKTGQQNDEVVRQASSDDIWLHVQRGPGGHVIIKTGGRPDDVPESTLVEAAGHAAALSHQAQSPKVEVDYTQVKHLNKPRGAPPGFVYYRDFQTVRVAPRRAQDSEPA